MNIIMTGTSSTYNQIRYYSQPSSVPTSAPVVQKSPNPPGFGSSSHTSSTTSSSSRNSGAGIITILLTLGVLALCVGAFLILGSKFGPFELKNIDAPTLQQLPQYVNQPTITVNGTAPANSNIEVYSNGDRVLELVADNDGKFAGQFKVDREKLYSINAVVVRNVLLRFRSPYSNTVETTYDQTAPSITLDKIDPNTNKQDITVTGKASEKARIIADVKGTKTELTTDNDGNFSLPLKLSTGKNEISVVAYDNANNAGKPEFATVTYTIPSIGSGTSVTSKPKPAALPNSAGSLASAMEGNFAKVLVAVFVVLGILGFGASYSIVWIGKNA